MTEAAANSPFVGESENARPSLSLDDAAGLDFEERDENANDEAEAEQQSTSETGEAHEDEGQETDETAAEGDEPTEPEDEGEKANDAEDIVVTLKGGEQVPLEELKSGYMRDRDYRHKTMALGEKSRSLESMSTRVANTANAIADFLASQLPPEPSAALAMQNPAEYTRQKAMHDAALTQVHKIIALGDEPKAVTGEMTQAATEETLAAENGKLLETFPSLSKPEARQKFFADAFDTARELGFTDEEMQGTTDHRMFKLAHYARLGLQAEQAKSKAMTKVKNAPPAAVKAKPNGPVNPQARKNQDAMKRLAKTGSIKDALLVDFD